MKISCLIIDDEPLARQRIFNLIGQKSELECLGEARTGKMAIEMIGEKEPDFIFLDIQMKDMNGFDVLNAIENKRPVVVFVTAYDHYAVKAFDFLAFDYLLKPFKKERFNFCVDRVVEHLKKDNTLDFDEKLNKLLHHMAKSNVEVKSTYFKNKLTIKTGKEVSFLETKDIKYILASGSYIDIHAVNKKYVQRMSLTSVLIDISDLAFSRIHRSTVIHLDFIDKLIHSDYGEIDVKMKDGRLFRVSNGYKREFLKTIGA